MSELRASFQETRYGFEWGGSRVTRIASFSRNSARQPNVCIGIGAAGSQEYENAVEVYVSPTGRSIRVFRDGKELK